MFHKKNLVNFWNGTVRWIMLVKILVFLNFNSICGLRRTGRNIQEQLSTVEGDITSSTTNLAVIQEQVNSQQEMTRDFSILLSELERQDSGFKRQFGDIQAKLIATDQVNSALNRRIAELEKLKTCAEKNGIIMCPGHS